MNDYPLSTKSSKKSRPKLHPLHSRSPLLQRSACQAPLTQPLKKQIYGHILKGEHVFIEIYYQGRVVQTAYPQYITFMGGQLCKRLSPKVSIFLTNLTPREMAPIRQRVEKVCPKCRVVSILWFQRCYQMKEKVPFDGYALDGEVELSDERSKDSIKEEDMGDFLNNIGEDIQNEYKQFFKVEKKRYFENLPKNHNKPADDVFPAKDYDLGPNQEKKARQKNNENCKKRRKSVKPGQSEKKKVANEGRQFKSTGPQTYRQTDGDNDEQQENGKVEEGEQIKKETASETKVQENRPSHFQNIMTKYLGMFNQYGDDKGSSSATVKSKRTPIVSQNRETSENRDTSSNHLLTQKANTQMPISSVLSKKSFLSAIPQVEVKKKAESHRFTFSKVGTKYKDVHRYEEPNSIDSVELESSLSAIAKANQNVLLVMTASGVVEVKVKEVNSEANHHSAVVFHPIKYCLFNAIAQRVSSPADIYFLINPKKASERALFLALALQQSPIKIKLASYRLIEEVTAYNRQIKNAQLRSPIKLQRSKLKFIKEMPYQVNSAFVKGKKIAFLQSELPCSVQQRVIQSMGGHYVLKENYLLNAKIDLIVTDRCWFKGQGEETIEEEAFWRRVIRLEGE